MQFRRPTCCQQAVGSVSWYQLRACSTIKVLVPGADCDGALDEWCGDGCGGGDQQVDALECALAVLDRTRPQRIGLRTHGSELRRFCGDLGCART